MIKLVCFLHRRPELDPDAFDRHWRERHGPLIAGLPDLARLVAGYEQNSRLPGDYVRDETSVEPGFDGATVMWFESIEDYDAYARHPLYAEHVAPDEERFLDRARTTWFLSEDADRIFGGHADEARAGLKLLALLRRGADVSIDRFHAHWSGPHAALFREIPALRSHTLAYQQNHRLLADYDRNPGTAWDGAAEQWYVDEAAFLAGAGGAPFRDHVIPDEERFLDRDATRFLLCAPPRRILDRR